MSYSRDEIVAMTTEYILVRDAVKNVDMDVLLFTGSSSSYSSTSKCLIERLNVFHRILTLSLLEMHSCVTT